jgi:serine/threonine-protein kinase
VTDLFHAALAHEPRARETFLDQECADDAALRQDVASLIAAHEDAGDYLTRPPSDEIDPPPLMEGLRLGHYILMNRVGVGGMGEVYRARDSKLGRDVAIKVLPRRFTADPERLARFAREARLLAALNHPRIGAIYGVEDTGDLHGLVLELVEGPTLADRLRDGPLPIDQALAIARQIAEALEAAHEKGIVHRDLKPANVKTTPDSAIKVIDFGLATVRVDGDGEPDRRRLTVPLGETREGVILGTAAYMSPEQSRGRPVDKRTDVWSFGCVLYELLTGRAAFSGITVSDTIAAVLAAQPDWRALPATTPAGIRHLLRRCLEKDPTRRLRDIGEARMECDSALAARAAGATSRRRQWIGLAVIVGVLAVAASALELRTRATSGRIQSLAVLPLENLSRDKEQGYFVDGMTEALITDLAKINALRVVPRTSVMRYKDTPKPLADIARELNVDAVVEGSVLQAGDRVRITVQLIRAATGQHLWADSYERDARDVLIVTDDVARTIAQKIEVTLTPEEHVRLSTSQAVDPEAYKLYIKGRYFWEKRTQDSIQRAMDYFRQAIDRDPAFAAAYSGVADCYSSLGSSFDVGSQAPSDVQPKAKAAALKALQLDDSLAAAHNSLAYVKLNYEWDWAGAEAEFKRAIELNPGYSHAHHWYAHSLISSGRSDEALASSRRALELDPLSPIINVHLGWHYLYSRQSDRALDQLGKTLELDPNNALASWYRGLAFEQKKQYPEALREMRSAEDRLQGNLAVRSDIGHVYAVSGNKGEAERVIRWLEQESARRYVNPYEVGLIYIGLGENDQAFAWLEKAYRERSDQLVYLSVDPRLDPVRSDTRFADLVRRVRVPGGTK